MALHDAVESVPIEARLDTPEMRLLGMTPLHTISSTLGEGGLRDRLLIEVARFPVAERERIGAALALMRRVHAEDQRQSEPYSTDNGVGLFHTTGESLPRRAAKYRPLVPVLRELLFRPDTPLEDDVRRMIAGKLDDAEARFAAICGSPAALRLPVDCHRGHQVRGPQRTGRCRELQVRAVRRGRRWRARRPSARYRQPRRGTLACTASAWAAFTASFW